MRKHTKLNTDGTPRKKYTTKKMIMAKNRKSGQKKAWDTRRALYPETNGYKPKMVEDKPKMELHKTTLDEVTESLSNLNKFLNSVPGVEFDKEKFIYEVLATAIKAVRINATKENMDEPNEMHEATNGV